MKAGQEQTWEIHYLSQPQGTAHDCRGRWRSDCCSVEEGQGSRWCTLCLGRPGGGPRNPPRLALGWRLPSSPPSLTEPGRSLLNRPANQFAMATVITKTRFKQYFLSEELRDFGKLVAALDYTDRLDSPCCLHGTLRRGFFASTNNIQLSVMAIKSTLDHLSDFHRIEKLFRLYKCSLD